MRSTGHPRRVQSHIDSGLIYVEGGAARPNLSLDDRTYVTRYLNDLARAFKSAVKPRFLFTLSVASAQGWDKSRGAFPEEVQLDAGVAVGPGYGASGYASERILAMSGLPATSSRIGQITGDAPRGAWSTFPSSSSRAWPWARFPKPAGRVDHLAFDFPFG